MRTVFVFRNGEVIDRADAEPRYDSADAPMIRPDGMDAIRSMADGKMYDSRSAYYRSVRRAGCEIVGDDRAPFDRRPTLKSAGIGEGVGRSIKNAIEKLESRR